MSLSRISVAAWLMPCRSADPGVDRARRVADILRQQIHAGAYPDGLPAEHELAAEFFVSRNTIREALAVLKKEGLIVRADPRSAPTSRSASTTTGSTRCRA